MVGAGGRLVTQRTAAEVGAARARSPDPALRPEWAAFLSEPRFSHSQGWGRTGVNASLPSRGTAQRRVRVCRPAHRGGPSTGAQHAPAEASWARFFPTLPSSIAWE